MVKSARFAQFTSGFFIFGSHKWARSGTWSRDWSFSRTFNFDSVEFLKSSVWLDGLERSINKRKRFY